MRNLLLSSRSSHLYAEKSMEAMTDIDAGPLFRRRSA
jgi:hypothetical protein